MSAPASGRNERQKCQGRTNTGFQCKYEGLPVETVDGQTVYICHGHQEGFKHGYSRQVELTTGETITKHGEGDFELTETDDDGPF